MDDGRADHTRRRLVVRGGRTRERAYGIHHLPLVDKGRPVGLVHLDEETPELLAVGLGY